MSIRNPKNMTFLEELTLENWFQHLKVDEGKYSELYSLYERMKDDGATYDAIAKTLTEFRNDC